MASFSTTFDKLNPLTRQGASSGSERQEVDQRANDNPLTRQGASSRSERRGVGQRANDNPLTRQGASRRSERRLDSQRVINKILTRQISISDAKDEEISTHIATDPNIRWSSTTVQNCEYKSNTNQILSNTYQMQNILNIYETNELDIKVKFIADVDPEILTTKECRSRYDKLIEVDVNKRHVGRRDREPSRIPAKKISRFLRKNKKIRKQVRKHIKRNVPKSSRIHRLFSYGFSCKQVSYYPRVKKLKTKCHIASSKHPTKQARASNTSEFLFENDQKTLDRNNNSGTTTYTTCTYKNLNHRMNCCTFNLSRDIETNPGPTFIDPSKTIHAPYSEGNVDLFGSNAGRQCVAMSLCSLIFNYSNGSITDSGDLIQIMNLGNELYSVLSRLLGQSYLLLSELPTMVTAKHKLST